MGVQIQIRNGVVTITVGGGSGGSKPGGDPGDTPPGQLGGDPGDTPPGQLGGDPGDTPPGQLGGDPGDTPPGPLGGGRGGGCCGTTVIGPIVISGRGASGGQTGGDPGDTPPGEIGGDPGDTPPGPLGGGQGGNCCCPTVIGPIVITDCCSGGGGTASTGAPTPVSVPPPRRSASQAGGGGLHRPFNMQQQEEHNWCWSAVAVSIHDYLTQNADNQDWTQGTLATPVLLKERQIPQTVDCGETPEKCNLPAALNDALNQTGDLAQNGMLVNQYLTYTNITQWIDASLPVGARIKWFGQGAHFIALDGYRVFTGQNQVHVQDPSWGPSYQDYDALVSNYPPGGYWSDTYLVK